MTSKTADWGFTVGNVAMHTGKFYWEVQDNSQTAKAAYGVCNNQYYEENGYQVGVNSIYQVMVVMAAMLTLLMVNILQVN